MKLLLTFGCSWTLGVGVNYEPGMTRTEFKSGAWQDEILDQYSFRALLAQDYNMHNINFALGGCSNQQQFRLAEEFFASNEFKSYQDQYDEIVVLWGITSVFRNEAYFLDIKKSKSFFYSNGSLLSKVIVTNHFDPQYEIELLSKKIRFWNKFFDVIKIKNLWFDTFNHHDYTVMPHAEIQQSYQENAGKLWPSWQKFVSGDFSDIDQEIRSEILNETRWEFYKYFYPSIPDRMFKGDSCPRDLMSQLAIKNGMTDLDDNYHVCDHALTVDSNRIPYLIKLGLLNPYSNHPTKLGHRHIADMLSDSLPINR